MNRNGNFTCITNNVGKDKRVGLRRVQDEEGIVHHKKEKIEQKLINYDKKHFSKAKESEV